MSSSAPLLDPLARCCRELVRRHGQAAPPAAQEALLAAVERLAAALGEGSTHLPLAAAEAAALRGHPLVAMDGASEARPFVIDATGALTLWRLHAAEQALAATIAERLQPRPLDPAAGAAALAKVFPDAAEDDPQRRAAAAALQRPLTVITGGPGTGKTWTAARVVAVCAAAGCRRIACAAPTGKAAARLDAALATARAGDAALDVMLAPVDMGRAQTCHRLLGYHPLRDRFARHADAPLAVDVLLVDEVSMIDLPLMRALLAACRPDTRVVLLGDPDQLASVESGFVLGDLVAAAAAGGALAPAVLRLTRVHRQRETSGIAALASAVRDGQDQAVADDVIRRPPPARGEFLPHSMPEFQAHCVALDACADAAAALAQQARFQLLTPLRRGPWGVVGIGAACQRWWRHHHAGPGEWYRGQPVLITANDPASGLMNGDLGLVWPDGHGRLRAWFAAGDQEPRSVALVDLPPWQEAWALTVHKSQGSEFHTVVLVLPPTDGGDHALVGRELCYTAITRARERLLLIAAEGALARAAGRRIARRSAFQARLEAVGDG